MCTRVELKASCSAPEESYDTSTTDYEYGKGNSHSVTNLKPKDKIDLFCLQKGGWCEAVVREIRRSTRAEYVERQRQLEEKAKRLQERKQREKERKMSLKLADSLLKDQSEKGNYQNADTNQTLADQSKISVFEEVKPQSHLEPSAYISVDNSDLDVSSEVVFEAKCHYMGWQSRYDEWVIFPSERVAVHHLHTAVTSREKQHLERKKAME